LALLLFLVLQLLLMLGQMPLLTCNAMLCLDPLGLGARHVPFHTMAQTRSKTGRRRRRRRRQQ
jgi:hypothetical protein